MNFAPAGLSATAKKRLAEVASRVSKVGEVDIAVRATAIARLRNTELRDLDRGMKADGKLVASLHILFDLAKQGWFVRVTGKSVEVSRPTSYLDPEQDRVRIRRQLHAERDEQLREPAVRAFIKDMETKRLHKGKHVSVLSLLRDGRELAGRLASDVSAIQPYLQFVEGEKVCPETGLRLVDIWRYFRHTWSSPYKSVPGRTMMILVRDRAVPFHPVIGIAALSSATVGQTARDEFIGWTYRQVADRFLASPSKKHFKWMQEIVGNAIDELYKNDLLEEGVLTPRALKNPTAELVARLIESAKHHRKQHYRLDEGADFKGIPDDPSDEFWEARARKHLFRSKREQELAHLLDIRLALNEYADAVTSKDAMAGFLVTSEGRLALTKLIRKAKAERVGTMIADLSICGAVPPYNEIVGGKLVAMLMGSPEVAQEYRRRYKHAASVIASSMAGRNVLRPSELVFISTTSLYGKRPNQYDRIVVPASRVADGVDGEIRYHFLEKTKGIGTFQFSPDTVEAMGRLLAQSENGQKVNSVFGEGVNPRLRKVRGALDELELPSNVLLDHGAPRIVYVLPLIHNLADFLLGIERNPDYVLAGKDAVSISRRIARYWYERWCQPRVGRPEVIERIVSHTLVLPIEHGAKVKLPPALVEEPTLFDRSI